MKTILCYGDSNTWGSIPDDYSRYPWGVRWTSLLEQALPDCRIEEEGLGGRTTVFEDDARRGRRGLDFLPIALKTHDPIDVVILMLGTNDTKVRFHPHASEIAEGVQALVETIQSDKLLHLRKAPEIVVVAPPLIDGEALKRGAMRFMFDASSVETTHLLPRFLREMAERMGVHFFDASLLAPTGSDGVHLSAEGHAALAKALAGFLQKSQLV